MEKNQNYAQKSFLVDEVPNQSISSFENFSILYFLPFLNQLGNLFAVNSSVCSGHLLIQPLALESTSDVRNSSFNADPHFHLLQKIDCFFFTFSRVHWKYKENTILVDQMVLKIYVTLQYFYVGNRQVVNNRLFTASPIRFTRKILTRLIVHHKIP